MKSIWGQEDGDAYLPRAKRESNMTAALRYGTSIAGVPLSVYLPSTWGNRRRLIIAGIHGEEAETTNLLSYVFRSIRPEFLTCAVILCVNPDGMIRGTRGNTNGVDLNRNFPSSDWRVGITTTRWENGLPSDTELHTGTHPASEPEVQALIDLISEHGIEEIVSIHAPLGCVNYEQTEEWAISDELSRRLALPIVRDIGYPCPGVMDKWADENNIRFLTLELEGNLSISEIRYKYGPVMQDVLLGEIFDAS